MIKRVRTDKNVFAKKLYRSNVTGANFEYVAHETDLDVGFEPLECVEDVVADVVLLLVKTVPELVQTETKRIRLLPSPLKGKLPKDIRPKLF